MSLSTTKLGGIGGSRLIRDFEIHKILGSGAFGVVLQVQHKIDQKKYAIKLIIDSESSSANEVKIFARIPAHENVVTYYTSWMDNVTIAEMRKLQGMLSASAMRIPSGVQHFNFLCIQMELCGQDLRHWLHQQCNVNLIKGKMIFRQILTGLQHVHNQGLIHRDLNPSNIVFAWNDSEKVKIGDFGISTIHQGTADASHTTLAGKILYLAPEQYTGTYGKSVDIYAMGLIYFEIFYPPAQKNLAKSLTDLKNLKTLPNEFKSWPIISKIILSMLEYDPKKRPTIEYVLENISGKKPATASAPVSDMTKIATSFSSMAVSKDHAWAKGHARSTGLSPLFGTDGLRVAVRFKAGRPTGILVYHPINVSGQSAEHDCTCMGCKRHPIKGIRYQCSSCDKFNYCRDCYVVAVSHRNRHEFKAYDKSSLADFPSGFFTIHHGIFCGCCETMPIIGRRYKCQTCPNFDLCRKCYESKADHRECHIFSVITKCQIHVNKHNCKETNVLFEGITQTEIMDAKEVIDKKEIIHPNIQCRGCGMAPIKGSRFECNTCQFFNFCEKCYNLAESHRQKHNFKWINTCNLRNVICSSCYKVVAGTLYTCKTCEDYDYCYICYYLNEMHRNTHPFHVYYD